MIAERKKANVMKGTREKAYAYCDNVKSTFDSIRYHADKLEIMVGTSKKLTVRDEYSEIVIEGEIVERYTGIVSSFREIAINDLGLLKSVKTKRYI